MNTTFQTRTEETRDDWQTPKELVDALGEFELDPCANCQNPARLADCGYTIANNGLALPWHGRVWLNPPYGSEARLWLRKLAEHGNGIALIPPRVGSIWFHEEVFAKCDAILFKKGRIAFIGQDGKPVAGNNADSIFVAFGANNVAALKASGIAGVLWEKENNGN